MSEISVTVSHTFPIQELQIRFQTQFEPLIAGVFGAETANLKLIGREGNFRCTTKNCTWTGSVHLFLSKVTAVVQVPKSVLEQLEVTRVTDDLRSSILTILRN